jgi:hypothetical protein
MSGLTDSVLIQDVYVTCKQQAGTEVYFPMEKLNKTTIHDDSDHSKGILPTSAQNARSLFEPPMAKPWLPVSADTTPLQIWEGTVLKVNHEEQMMSVMLNAKMGQVPRHQADISFEWVSDQDLDLIVPGAVFYLTLFKRTNRGSIQNSQELRFRRRPSWSKVELERVEENATELLSKMTALSSAK